MNDICKLVENPSSLNQSSLAHHQILSALLLSFGILSQLILLIKPLLRASGIHCDLFVLDNVTTCIEVGDKIINLLHLTLSVFIIREYFALQILIVYL